MMRDSQEAANTPGEAPVGFTPFLSRAAVEVSVGQCHSPEGDGGACVQLSLFHACKSVWPPPPQGPTQPHRHVVSAQLPRSPGDQGAWAPSLRPVVGSAACVDHTNLVSWAFFRLSVLPSTNCHGHSSSHLSPAEGSVLRWVEGPPRLNLLPRRDVRG